jgi:hypothetical protein
MTDSANSALSRYLLIGCLLGLCFFFTELPTPAAYSAHFMARRRAWITPTHRLLLSIRRGVAVTL